MLTNSDIYLCSDFQGTLTPLSPPKQLLCIPKNLQRTSNSTFTLCEPYTSADKKKRTRILEMNINGESRNLADFEDEYTSWDFHDDYALLLNKEGDFLFYNMYNKNVVRAEKQHPGLYVDAEIMHTNAHFITCGGSVKNQVTGTPERIIKIWAVDGNDCLVQKSRINTGHDKPIEHSFLINKSSVVSFSSDRTIRFINLATEELSCIIRTDLDLLAGCQVDYNTVIAGGNSRAIKLYDQRMRRALHLTINMQASLIQLVNFTRFTDNHVLVSNINEISSLDLRNWQLQPLATYEGQRISEVLTLNSRELVIGNKEKTLQFWKAG